MGGNTKESLDGIGLWLHPAALFDANGNEWRTREMAFADDSPKKRNTDALHNPEGPSFLLDGFGRVGFVRGSKTTLYTANRYKVGTGVSHLGKKATVKYANYQDDYTRVVLDC